MLRDSNTDNLGIGLIQQEDRWECQEFDNILQDLTSKTCLRNVQIAAALSGQRSAKQAAWKNKSTIPYKVFLLEDRQRKASIWTRQKRRKLVDVLVPWHHSQMKKLYLLF